MGTEIEKLIGYAAAGLVLFFILKAFLPLIIVGLVLCGIWYVYEQVQGKKK